jgi:hypothetical protein
MNPRNYVVIAALLLAAPLSAQVEQRTLVPDVNVNLPPLEITNEITVMSDSAMIANLNRNLEALRVEIASQECNTCGGANTTTKIAVAVLIPVLVWIAWELRGIKNNSAGVPGEPGRDGSDGVDGEDGTDGEHHDHGRRKDHDSES